MRAGILRERLTIVQDTRPGDSHGGGGASVPTTLATVWGSVLPLNTAERLQAAALGSNVSYQVEIRYRADLTPKMRLLWTPFQSTVTKTLQIHGVTDPDNRRTRLLLDCAERI